MERPASTSSPTRRARPFGLVRTIDATAQHMHTAILLHGRGSSGDDFRSDLLSSTAVSGQESLAQILPGWRWVFPSARLLWSAEFQEEMPSWFESADGIRDSATYLERLIAEEVARLGGSAADEHRVVLGGVSQGGAVALWTLLMPMPRLRLGGFIGASTWLPFVEILDELPNNGWGGEAGGQSGSAAVSADGPISGVTRDLTPSPSTPIFLGHGIDDAFVDVALGRQARDVLVRLGFIVEWKEYSGAEQEGHWLKMPEEVDDIVHFLLLVSSLPDPPDLLGAVGCSLQGK